VAFDSYFDTNNTIYVVLADAAGHNGIYRWVIGQSSEWENLSAEPYNYTGLVLNNADGNPMIAADTGGVLYASYVNGDTTGVARCMTPADGLCCDSTSWDYLIEGLTSAEAFIMMPRALKICGGLTPDCSSKLFAIDGLGDYDMAKAEDGTVWTFFTAGRGCEVDISLVLQGGSRPSEGWEVPITIKFFNPGADVMTGSPLYEFSLNTTKSDGMAISQCTVAPGTYDVTVVSEHTLINVKRNVVISTPSTAVDMGTLLEGNANDDSIINISDFGILAVSYMKTDGEPGYDARADFDRNGIINISDFGLLAVNYMQMSPIDVPG